MTVTAVGTRRPTRYVAIRNTFSLGTAGVGILLVGAWGGIVPFVGPVFGFAGDGSASWHWTLAHALLAVVPGAAAVGGGALVALAGGLRYRPGGSRLGGLLAVVCGAWFVIGPVAWPVLEHARVFVGATPVHELAYWVGYSLGPGALLLALGAFSVGRPLPAPDAILPVTAPVRQAASAPQPAQPS